MTKLRDKESRRYTRHGITIVALDRMGRGLHRARAETFDERRWEPTKPTHNWLPWVAVLCVFGLLLANIL